MAIGPSSGTMPSGRGMAASRSCTRWRAKYLSTPSSKTSDTTDRPKIVRDRITSRAGTLPIASSIGTVTWRSISSGARPGNDVMTSTCCAEMSG